jgi:protein-S-isoprenylcysteine O-methyltransferase Ste14
VGGLVGGLLAIAGALLAVRSGLLLAGRGRPRRGPQPTFVLAGPYLRLRNPLLAGLIVAGAGLALVYGRTSLWLVVVAAAASAHAFVVLVEEPRLLARFGEAYRAYREAVPRWLPRR